MNHLRLPWNYISRKEAIDAGGLAYEVEWGLRNCDMIFIGKFMPQDVALHILKLVNKGD